MILKQSFGSVYNFVHSAEIFVEIFERPVQRKKKVSIFMQEKPTVKRKKIQ